MKKKLILRCRSSGETTVNFTDFLNAIKSSLFVNPHSNSKMLFSREDGLKIKTTLVQFTISKSSLGEMKSFSMA